VEDAAQAHGAEIDGRRVGTFGKLACFSFYPGKNLGAYGDAGAIVTNDESLAVRCRMIADHGRVINTDHDIEGMNSRLDGLQGAILSVKLHHLDAWTERRRRPRRALRRTASGQRVATPAVAPGMRHVYHLYAVRMPDRDVVQAALKGGGDRHGGALSDRTAQTGGLPYLSPPAGGFPGGEPLCRRTPGLPMFPK